MTKPPKWQELKYPDEDTFIDVMKRYPDLEGQGYYELPAWIRLGWPNEALWNSCNRTDERERAREQKTREPQPWPVARKPWGEVLALYPHRSDVREDEQDFHRVLKFWP